MSDLQSLAKQKAEAAMEQRMRQLPRTIQTLQNTLAAKGSLRSGRMLREVRDCCRDAMNEQAATLIAEYRWAVATALLASQSWVEQLVVEANESMEPLYEASIGHVKRALALAHTPRLESQLLSELADFRSTLKNDVALALRSSFAERRRGLVRMLPSFVGRVVGKFFGGGHP